VRCALTAAFYPPEGARGIGPHCGSQFEAMPGDEYFEAINDEVTVLLMMEEADAVETIVAITDL
jgi:2-keto-3-deoxy-L-rhamnonate aldolase RhmA